MLGGGGTIYRLYRVPLQKMGNVMSPELGKDLLPNLEVIAACQCRNNQQIFDILEVKFPDEFYGHSVDNILSFPVGFARFWAGLGAGELNHCARQ